MKPYLYMLALIFIAACGSTKPTDDQLAAAEYGPAPANYAEIARKWVTDQHGNVQQAGLRDLQIGEPKKGWQSGGALSSAGFSYGWEVEVNYSYQETQGRRTVRVRNMVQLLIHDGKVISYKEYQQ